MTKSENYQNIFVAVDFEHQPETLVHKAINIAKDNAATVKLVHCVMSLQEYYTSSYGGSDVWASIDFLEAYEAAVKESNKQLAKLADLAPDVVTETETLSGHIVESLITSATDYKADLIITGSHGKHGLQLILGSTASGVLHRAPCDSLVVRL